MPGTNTIVMYVAFDLDSRGQAIAAIEPRQAESEEAAISAADELATTHAGSVAWRREARPAIGEIGEPVVIFQRGKVGDFA